MADGTLEAHLSQRRTHIQLYSVSPESFADISALSADEREHAQRIRHPNARAQFIGGRVALRKYLAPRVGSAARALRFIRGDHGKPALCPHTHPGAEPGFNLSHCRDRIVLAITTDGPVGVDIERCDRILKWEPIARRFFSETEVTALLQLPLSLRQHAFMRTWVRKEALLKAHGGGIACGLSRFDLRVHPTAPARLLRSRIPGLIPDQWQITDVELIPSHFVAVATNRTQGSIGYLEKPAPLVFRGTLRGVVY